MKHTPSIRIPILAACAGLSMVAVAGCGGSNSLSSNSAAPAGGSSTVSVAPAKDDALAAKLPAKIKQAGKIVVGMDTSYPPNEFLGTDGKTAQGMDVDLFSAVAAKFGVKAEFTTATFDTIILGVGSGRYDVGVSSFTINPQRKQSVDMVSYYNAGTLWATAKGNPKKVDPNNACGLAIGAQKGTVQIDDLTARSKKCTAAGKPAIQMVIDDLQVKVTNALVSGKVVAMAADSPITNYAIKQSNDSLEKLGEVYDSAPYGFVVAKGQTEFAQALVDALKELEKSGDYGKVLSNWGLQDGAMKDFALNP